MRYPNLRYGDPAAVLFHTSHLPEKDRVKILARQLRRSERTVYTWLTYEYKMPWWVPELLRLQRMEYELRCYQMRPRPGARPWAWSAAT